MRSSVPTQPHNRQTQAQTSCDVHGLQIEEAVVKDAITIPWQYEGAALLDLVSHVSISYGREVA